MNPAADTVAPPASMTPSQLATLDPADPFPAALPSLLARMSKEERTAALRELLTAWRRRIAEAHQAGRPGDETARAWSRAIDHVVTALLRVARATGDAAQAPPLALVPVGGYGRAELCPGSDLDLWFITDRPDHPEVARLANEILYPLWDLKIEVGHAVRSVDDCLSLAQGDLAAATALLDARFLDGERALYARLAADYKRRLSQREAGRLVEKLQAEKAARHERFGDTVYLLEPNVKNGEGGYRDLLLGLWAAKARFHVNDFPDLVTLGQATARQVAVLVEARRFFLTVRTAAHLSARRRQDRLLFEIQEAIAPALAAASSPGAPYMAMPIATHATSIAGIAGQVKPAVAPAVEALMQRYYLHAKAVKRESDRLLERCAAEAPRRPRVRRLDASFVLWNGQLSTTGPEVFRERPSEMVRLFRVALDTGAPIYGHTQELIAEACARPDIADALAADPGSALHFKAFLVDDRDKRSPSLLEQMHDLGLLVALMPEFGPCTGRVQHDLYHVFTVDQHQLYATQRLKAVARGELGSELPVATRVIREVPARLALYLGTLLHDVGKPLGKGHSEKGARLAHSIGRRLQLSDDEQAQVEFLVRHHLLLAHLAQRRDLNDAEMIERLARQLGGAERLRELFLLTVADMAMVAPGNLTTWKAQLLRELYARTLGHYRRGPDLAGADPSRVVARRRARVLELLGVVPASTAPPVDESGDADDDKTPAPATTGVSISEADARRWLAGLPDRYFAQNTPRDIARHARLSHRRRGPVAAELMPRPRNGFWELVVIGADAPGLLARITGALLASRLDIHGAQISSRDLGDGTAEAIDVFAVRDVYTQDRGLSGARGQRLLEDLERVGAGHVSVADLLAERRERSTLPARVTPHVATEIDVDDEVSSDFTVLDVYTQDRPGVLYTITHTLSSLGLDIHLSKVATEADRVADVFYVRDAAHEKLDKAAAAAVVATLHDALAQLA